MAAIDFNPNFDPDTRIPNNPFYSPLESVFNTPSGLLIFGAGISINYATGIVSVDPTPPASLGYGHVRYRWCWSHHQPICWHHHHRHGVSGNGPPD